MDIKLTPEMREALSNIAKIRERRAAREIEAREAKRAEVRPRLVKLGTQHVAPPPPQPKPAPKPVVKAKAKPKAAPKPKVPQPAPPNYRIPAQALMAVFKTLPLVPVDEPLYTDAARSAFYNAVPEHRLLAVFSFQDAIIAGQSFYNAWRMYFSRTGHPPLSAYDLIEEVLWNGLRLGGRKKVTLDVYHRLSDRIMAAPVEALAYAEYVMMRVRMTPAQQETERQRLREIMEGLGIPPALVRVKEKR